jgi:hypothetical protein
MCLAAQSKSSSLVTCHLSLFWVMSDRRHPVLSRISVSYLAESLMVTTVAILCLIGLIELLCGFGIGALLYHAEARAWTHLKELARGGLAAGLVVIQVVLYLAATILLDLYSGWLGFFLLLLVSGLFLLVGWLGRQAYYLLHHQGTIYEIVSIIQNRGHQNN